MSSRAKTPASKPAQRRRTTRRKTARRSSVDAAALAWLPTIRVGFLFYSVSSLIASLWMISSATYYTLYLREGDLRRFERHAAAIGSVRLRTDESSIRLKRLEMQLADVTSNRWSRTNMLDFCIEARRVNAKIGFKCPNPAAFSLPEQPPVKPDDEKATNK